MYETVAIHWRQWHAWTHFVSLCFSLPNILFTLPVSTLLPPPCPVSLPPVNLLLTPFSDKKLERGKWNFAIVCFLSFFSSFPVRAVPPSFPFLLPSFLAVNLLCISFRAQGPSEIKLCSRSLVLLWKPCKDAVGVFVASLHFHVTWV